MVHNRTTIARATAAAVIAMTAGSMPCVAAYASSTGSHKVVQLSEFHALRESAAWSQLHAKLRRWKSLPLDWDGDDGIAPPAETIDACHQILNELASVAAPAPSASVAGDGEITYEWERGDGYASLSMTADGHLIGFLREAGVDEPLRLDEPYHALALRPFLERIGAFA